LECVELAPAFAEGACSHRFGHRYSMARTGLEATAASCLTESGGKPHALQS
jgi:hypothetical protein